MTLIVAPRELPVHLKEKITAVSPNVKLITTDDKDVLARYWPQMEILLGGRMDKELLLQCPNLRWVQTTSAGVERYLFPEFRDSDIRLTNVRGMHAQTITEHIFMFMLALARHLRLYIVQQKAHYWNRQEVELLFNKNLLIIGLGGIGQHAAQLGNAIGMKVTAVDVTDKQLPFVEKTYLPSQLNLALATADYVVMAAPHTKDTNQMMGEAQFATMKETAFFINIGRGKTVDESALIEALQNRVIAGAGLDVFETEPLPKDSPLYDMSNVLITPHMAGNMPDYMDHAVEIFCENLERYLKGQPLHNEVDKQAGF